MSTSSTDPVDHVFWLSSRAFGIVAWLALSLSVVLGLAMALKLAPPRLRPMLVVAHERVALVALGTLGLHGVLLIFDAYLSPSLLDVLVPFRVDHARFWTGLGQLGGWIVAALSLSYYARRRIGTKRWRRAHRFTPVAWVLGAAHVIGAGTDIGDLWLQVPFALTIAAVLALLLARVRGSTRDRRGVPHPAMR
jgi:methionine sulfoxide reductase heme-binding subunit